MQNLESGHRIIDIDVLYFTDIKITHKVNLQNPLYYQELRLKGTTCAVAIANDGNMYAYVRRIMDNTGSGGLRSKYHATIKNPLISCVKEFDICGALVAVCYFNKQITKFIVHNHKDFFAGKILHKIYPLNTDNHNEKSQKTLQDYFKQKGICKNLQASKLMKDKE